MKSFTCCWLLLLFLSCSKEESDFLVLEYSDWYTVTSPVDDVIQGVWGDRDKTLLISTTYAIFRSTDKGTNWQQVDQQQSTITGIIEYNDTLFAMNGLVESENRQILVNAGKYSIDDGKSWLVYSKHNPYLDSPPSFESIDQQLYINPVRATSATVYSINRVYLDSTTLWRRFDTPGVVASDGRKIDLPHLHQLRSLYLDNKFRLYIAASDAICERNKVSQSTLFCNSKAGRGIVYISKSPLP